MTRTGAGGSGAGGASVTELADRYVAAYFDAFPQAATFAGVADGPHDRLADISPEAQHRWESTEDSILAALQSIPSAELSPGSAEAVTHGFLLALLRNTVDWRACHMELWNVSPTWTGWQSEMAVLANSQPLGTPEKNDAAYRRFSQLPRYLGQEIENLRRGLEAGYSAPRRNVQSVIEQMDRLLGAPISESPFVSMAPDSMPDLRSRMEQLETEQLRPAITRYREFLQNEYLARARTGIAVSENPGGAGCYAAAVRFHSTVDISAENVHQTGLDQMAFIKSEMQSIADRSFQSQNIDTVLQRMRAEPQFFLGSRDAKMQLAKDAVERAAAAVPRWFGRVAQSPVEVQAVPSFNEASAPDGFYNNPAEDGSRPGIYYINLYRAETTPRAGLESTAFHETYPGHHLQISLAMERSELHPVSRYFFLSGFAEGWALYSERLADEMQLFSTDVDRLGMLSAQAMRAARLVVDAGMHALGWSRERAIQYMLENTAESEEAVTAEIDRYIAVPGQATSYMLGSLEIMKLRGEAEQALGNSFDIRDFHDAVLEDGSVPLSMLREKIQRWIAEHR